MTTQAFTTKNTMATKVTKGLFSLAILVTTLVAAVAAQQPALRVLPVQGNVHMIAGAGMNLTVHVGAYGVLVVDTPSVAATPQVMTEIRRLSNLPVRFIINTSVNGDAIGGNAALAVPPGARGGGAPFGFVGLNRASVIAHENVLNRLANPPAGSEATPAANLPTSTYFLPTMDFSNGEAVILYHVPAAHTDSDTIVLFRESDVISTGAIFTPGQYPVIDVARGGSVDEGASRHSRTTPRSSSHRFRLDPSLGASQSAATACQARAHHGTSCPWYTLASASLSGASTEVLSLQLWCWFGLGWSELKVHVSNSF
jgi:glyoxylase-like metal-dependent hydrolase (beta-lactamase superfamily II)